jgi:hypothetical protein
MRAHSIHVITGSAAGIAALTVFLDPGTVFGVWSAADTLTCFPVNQPARPAVSV